MSRSGTSLWHPLTPPTATHTITTTQHATRMSITSSEKTHPDDFRSRSSWTRAAKSSSAADGVDSLDLHLPVARQIRQRLLSHHGAQDDPAILVAAFVH